MSGNSSTSDKVDKVSMDESLMYMCEKDEMSTTLVIGIRNHMEILALLLHSQLIIKLQGGRVF